jgi:hypothetical protein
MKHFLTLFILVALGATTINEVQAQRWNRYKKEVGLTLGASNLMGDLGGGPNDGSQFGDFQIENSRFAVGGFFKYRFHDRFAAKFNLIYAQLYADDKTTANPGRRNRNLDARVNLLEFSGQLEFYIFKEVIGSQYKIKGVKGYGSSVFAMYIFAGLGASHFTPYGTDASGAWVKLPPLNTEGQGLPGGPSDYSQMAMVFPLGLGLKYNITREFGIQFEGGVRFTTTDYLDDVSNTYYDPTILAQQPENGPLSAYMSDKRIEGREYSSAIRGGNAKKDAYVFGLLSLTYRLRSKARSRVRL